MSLNQQDETPVIRAIDAPQMMRDLQRMKRQLELLRRKLLLTSIEHCSSDSKRLEIWQKLKPEEKQDNEIVYKFLSCYTMFGSDPWSADNVRNEVTLPQKFLSDPQAVLAFLSNERCKSSYHKVLTVPICLRDNKDVMLAVCGKFPQSFEQASSRLRDDEDLVRVALRRARSNIIKYVSKRLQKDKNMLRYIETLEDFTTVFAGSWLYHLKPKYLDVEEQKEISKTIVRCLANVDHIPHSGYLDRFSHELRDDKEFVLPFLQLKGTALWSCSDRLCCDSDCVAAAVSQDINAYQYAKGAILEEYMQQRTLDSVLDEVSKGLKFEYVPENLKSNKAVVRTAWKAGNLFSLDQLSEALQNDKELVLELVATSSAPIFRNCPYWRFYLDLPEQLKADEDIAAALLKAGFPNRGDILHNAPILLSSREAMMKAVALPECHYRDVYKEYPYNGDDDDDDDDEEVFATQVGQCDFCDDEEFMLSAYKSDRDTFRHASQRLRSSRTFLDRILEVSHDSCTFITEAPPEFQAENQDFIVRVIEHAKRDDDWWWRELNDLVWSNKNVIMACLQKGWPTLSYLDSILGSDSFHLSDKDIIFRSVMERPSHLQYASRTLREDRDFILSLVKETDRALFYAPPSMKRDKDILLAAAAQNSQTILDCFDSFELEEDFEFLCEFTLEIRSAISTHRSFLEFLCGVHDEYDPECPLRLLNVDAATGTALKKAIAEYAGIRLPMTPHFQTLSAALANMEKVGY